MNARIFSVVMAVTVISLSTGCSGMRNFMFGRGSRCGLCQRLSAAGDALNPMAPAPYGPAAQPNRGQAPCPPPQNYPGRGPTCGYESAPCGNCTGSGYFPGGYRCGGNVTSGYGSINDPYLGGQSVSGDMIPYDGQIIEGPVLSDDWSQRSGGQVGQPEQLPPGTQND